MAKAKKAAAKKAAKPAKKPAAKAKAPAKKPAAKAAPAKKAAKPAPAAAPAIPRARWFDASSSTPLIEEQARRLESFVAALADGKVEAAEVKAQEERLVGVMKEVDALLDDAAHERVTQLLCELTAYDLMNTLYAMDQARPKAVFQG